MVVRYWLGTRKTKETQDTRYYRRDDTMNILFVGEKRSKTAIEKDWTWEDGHLAAKQLFDALKSIGVGLAGLRFTNVFNDRGEPSFNPSEIQDSRVIAMGMLASKELDRLGVEHDTIIHPAARGKIRKKERYARHLSGVIYKQEK